MQHLRLCFQVLVSLKPKFSLFVSVAVLADAVGATVILMLRTWQIKCTWDWPSLWDVRP